MMSKSASFPKMKVQKKIGFSHGSNMVETLEPHDEELTKEDMMKLEQQGVQKEEEMLPTPHVKQLTVKKMSNGQFIQEGGGHFC